MRLTTNPISCLNIRSQTDKLINPHLKVPRPDPVSRKVEQNAGDVPYDDDSEEGAQGLCAVVAKGILLAAGPRPQPDSEEAHDERAQVYRKRNSTVTNRKIGSSSVSIRCKLFFATVLIGLCVQIAPYNEIER